MKYLSRKPLSVLSLNAIVLPIIGVSLNAATVAQADPPDFAPAYGYRNKGNKNKDKGRGKHRGDRDFDNDGVRDSRDNDDDNDGIPDHRDNDDDNDGILDRDENNSNNGNYDNDGNRNNLISFTGIVTRNADSERRFQIRANDGRYYNVVSRNREPLRLNVGDRVQVTGRIYADRGNDTFFAESVRILRQSDDRPNYGNQENFTGVVTGSLNGNRLLVRRDNSVQNYIVQTDRDTARTIQRGERVRVQGELIAKGTIRATDIDRLGYNGGTGYGDNTTGAVRFSGTVVRIISSRQIEVRGNDNRTYYVTLNRLRDTRIDVGDTVFVTGQASGNTILNATATLTRNGNNNGDGTNYGGNFPGGAQRVNFTGTVLGYNNGLLSVRGDNGRIYRVRWVDVKVGGHVRIQGTYVNGIVNADNVFYA